MIYSSIDNKKIKEIKKLNIKKYRDELGLFLVEGEHLVQEAYKSGDLEELILLENSDFKLDIKTSYVTKNVLKYISNLENPQEMLGICRKKNNNEIKGNKILILDDIQDPGNFGTIIRSSVAFNIDTIIISKTNVDLYNEKVIRASQGLIFYINIIVMDIKEAILNLKNDDYKIYGTKVIDGKSLKSIEKFSNFAIIMGKEGNGIHEEYVNLCDEYIYIDMNKNCESLNVGVATSIILYEFNK